MRGAAVSRNRRRRRPFRCRPPGAPASSASSCAAALHGCRPPRTPPCPQNGCASAWDTVEELSAKKAHEKAKEVPNDPLEKYCATEPDADECRVHDN